MKNTFLKAVILTVVFFAAGCCMLRVDNICSESAGENGKLVLAVDNYEFFH